jgi:hypothetical protein
MLGRPSVDRLRAIRAIEVLERLATPAAKDVLRKLAAGAADAAQTKVTLYIKPTEVGKTVTTVGLFDTYDGKSKTLRLRAGT